MAGLVLWFGWTGYQSFQTERREAHNLKIASVTAHLFVASAKYRDQPEIYTGYRDSLLAAKGTTKGELDSFPGQYGEDVFGYRNFVGLLDNLVDSLYRMEDSIRRANDTTTVAIDTAAIEPDSIRAARARPRRR